ncbi:diguanylate cyclase [Enterovibrio norvegicus]|uniref:Diguanylate cyclase domain-containing protein n=1 Tax=Enterovibrio norvegicus TaxID=188144 RepID=A0ABV4KWL0_9GAMM|nr:sensor domain-containing diguanylate cyclase [Enterovibrio norvegicus]OEE49061.1 diguanylate cyclase [Enterovibrio norvegicus]OEF55914.1 diguanylate cyclase [Enterovibrio norvegicus]
MKNPALPSNEMQRIQALHHLNVLDTGAEERFDRLTRLAQQLYACDEAMISFIDSKRQWVKSQAGQYPKEIPRELSFCAHVILSNDPLIVNDASQDPRFANNPWVVGEQHVRFYAAVPIKHSNGTVIGSISIWGSAPRDFPAEDITSLKDIADLVEHELAAMEISTQDYLTGLLNEAGFTVLAQNSLNMCDRMELPVSLAYFDLKDIARINQKHGNKEGDRALAFFGELLRFGFRNSDVLGRLASDKFVVLMANTSLESTYDTLRRFKERVERSGKERNLNYHVEYSVGLSWVDDQGHYHLDTLLNAARSEVLASK